MPNALAGESSPYLRQHADNPVDWHPWGAEALARARAEDKPILLSVGYAACHWCHVMAHESFENPEIARLMNERFVNVKVDREERPDLDGIYMQAVQAMTGHGGWPMTVFLTPDGAPFYGGTYFPPEDRHGLPGFPRLLRSVSEAWRSRRDEVGKAAATLVEYYAAAAAPLVGSGPFDRTILARGFGGLVRAWDRVRGGFGGAPKFPQAMALEFALHHAARTGDPEGIAMARESFLAMARGGIYDQVGGGFHRYSVDAYWLVPHFEKMLYDNALLAQLGTHLWQRTADGEVRRVTVETLDWVLREMTDESGGWYSSLDADSEGEEGKFYVWSLDEVRSLLGDSAPEAARYWGITARGNFEGKNILFRPSLDGGGDVEPDFVVRAKRALYSARAKRVWPARDEKVLASWNGLMLRAMAEAARVFGEPRFLVAAVRNGEFLANALMRDGRVLRSWMRGEARIRGFLEDHASVALGLVALYQLTFDRSWLDRARLLADACVSSFWDERAGAFFDTAHDHERLVTRPRGVADGATPAGTSLAVELLLTMAEYFDDAEARERALRVLTPLAEPMAQHALTFGHLLRAGDLAVRGAVEVAIAGDPAAGDFGELARAAARVYVPGLVLAGGSGAAARGLPLLERREARNGRATAYVCRRYACDAPTTDPEELAAQLPTAVSSQI